MWTLRDLWMFLNPNYARQQQEQEDYIRRMGPALSQGLGTDGYGGLREALRRRWETINTNPSYKPEFDRPETIQDYYKGTEQGYNSFKNPYQYKGML